jgi:hypothetical protein
MDESSITSGNGSCWNLKKKIDCWWMFFGKFTLPFENRKHSKDGGGWPFLSIFNTTAVLVYVFHITFWCSIWKYMLRLDFFGFLTEVAIAIEFILYFYGNVHFPHKIHQHSGLVFVICISPVVHRFLPSVSKFCNPHDKFSFQLRNFFFSG